MAVAQQKQRKYVDKFKIQTPKYTLKNIIWSTLKNIITAIENKKFDAKQTKYITLENVRDLVKKLRKIRNMGLSSFRRLFANIYVLGRYTRRTTKS